MDRRCSGTRRALARPDHLEPIRARLDVGLLEAEMVTHLISSRTHRTWPVALSLVSLMLAAWPSCAQELKGASSILAAKIAESGRKRVAVVDFTDLQGNVTELGRFLAEDLSGELVNDARGFRVIDRTHLKALLQEHKLAATGLIDPETARQLGKIAGVDTLVTGTITSAFGDTVRLMIKALDVSTAEVIGQNTVDIPKTKAIEELLAKGISSTRNTTTPQITSPPPADPGALVASQKVDSFSFALKGCQQSGARILCKLLITNQGEDARLVVSGRNVFSRAGNKRSRIIDVAGNEYSAEMVGLGNMANEGEVQNLLVSGVPVSLTLTFGEVTPDTNGVALLEIVCYRYKDNIFNGTGFSVQMRNIPLAR